MLSFIIFYCKHYTLGYFLHLILSVCLYQHYLQNKPNPKILYVLIRNKIT